MEKPELFHSDKCPQCVGLKTNSVDPDQAAQLPVGAVLYGSSLFAKGINMHYNPENN